MSVHARQIDIRIDRPGPVNHYAHRIRDRWKLGSNRRFSQWRRCPETAEPDWPGVDNEIRRSVNVELWGSTHSRQDGPVISRVVKRELPEDRRVKLARFASRVANTTGDKGERDKSPGVRAPVHLDIVRTRPQASRRVTFGHPD